MVSFLPRWIWIVFVALLLAGGTWLMFRWQPERFLPARFDTFVDRVENNHWRMAGWLVSDNYSDQWDFDKESLLKSGASVFRHFRWLEIQRGTEEWSFEHDRATVTVTLVLRGEGTQLATMAKDTASEATGPYLFTWRKTGSMPWQWYLVSIDQPELNLRRWRDSR